MIGVSFWRITRAAFQNFFRNIWLSIATMVIMTITLLIVSFLYFANLFGLEVLHNVQQKVDLSITFKDSAETEQVETVARNIEARKDVMSVDIVTSEEAIEIFKERNKDKSFIEESLNELEANPLPATMFIVATDPKHYQAIADHMNSDRYEGVVEEVKYENSRDVIDRLVSIIDTIKSAGILVTGIFAVLVVLIMFNTVRLAIYSFREEIDIMHLVGASRWFIRGPFIIESVFVALISVILATLIIYPTLRAASPELQQFFFADLSDSQPFDVYAFAVANWPKIIGIEALVAIGLAFISSLIAIQRYLKS